MTEVTVAALQLAFTDNIDTDIAATVALVRAAAGQGAQIILPPELFEGHYFCRHERGEFFARAHPLETHPAVEKRDKIFATNQLYQYTSTS